MKYKVGVVSLGCDKNLVDTENMLGLLSKKFDIVNDESSADIIIVNTCAFIESAKTESINAILDLADNKTEGNCKLLIVTGCMAQRYKDEIFKELPEVDAIVGTGSYHEIVDVIETALVKPKVKMIGDINSSYSVNERILTTPKHYAYLKIAEGCSNYCTYCVIPQIRGKYRSKKIEDILSEANTLVKNGVRELIIIAQDTTKYGTDLYNKPMISELLNNLCEIKELKWIRLMYCYPEGINDELIFTIKNQDKICNYLDIPIQHCSDEVLKRMGRRSNYKDITRLISHLRHNIPDICIRTSIIVGFPGETDVQFNELIDFIKEYKLDRVGAFKYSKEEGTPASKLPSQVPEKTKKQRLVSLMLAQQEVSHKKNEELIGRVFDCIIDEPYDDGIYLGRAYKDAPDVDCIIYINSKKKLALGDNVRVKISEFEDYDLTGEIVDELS